MAEGASQLLNTMIATPESVTSDHLVFLQRYLLEMCRSLHFLGLSSTARHANLIWHMRDSYLSNVHQLVPKATKDALRVSPLNSEHLFKEETVAIASDNLKSDLQLQTNQKALLRLQPPASTRGTAKRPTGQQGVRNPTPKRVRFEPPGSFQGAARGWNPTRGNQYPKKSGRGRGRGKPK